MRDKQEGSQCRQKSESFRKTIRQKELDSFFEERRKQIMMRNDIETLLKELGTTVKQHDFLADCGRQLTGQPQQAWSKIIYQLRKAVTLFEGQFDVWISQNIVSSLTLALRVQYKHLMLGPDICLLLSDMVTLSWENATSFPKRLMEYEPVPNIIALLDDNTTPIERRLQMLLFLGNISSSRYNYRDSIVRDGAGRVSIQMGQQLLNIFQNGQMDQLLLYKYLSSSQGFLRIFNKTKGIVYPNLNLVNSYLPILMAILTNQRSTERTLRVGLRCMNQILRIEKQALYSTIFQFKDFMRQIVSFLSHKQLELRTNAALAINYLTYSEKWQISAEFLSLGILDVMAEAFAKYEHSNPDALKRTMLIIMSNITANSEAMAELVFNHRIFGVVIQQFSSQNVENQRDAFFTLDSIVEKLKFNSLQKLMGQYDILKHLVKGIADLQGTDSRAIFQILNSISVLLQKTQEIYYHIGNPLVDRLQRFFNFTAILDRLADNCRHNKLLYELIQKVQNQLLQTHMGDSPVL